MKYINIDLLNKVLEDLKVTGKRNGYRLAKKEAQQNDNLLDGATVEIANFCRTTEKDLTQLDYVSFTTEKGSIYHVIEDVMFNGKPLTYVMRSKRIKPCLFENFGFFFPIFYVKQDAQLLVDEINVALRNGEKTFVVEAIFEPKIGYVPIEAEVATITGNRVEFDLTSRFHPGHKIIEIG